MKTVFAAVVLAVIATACAVELLPYDAVADSKAVVYADNGCTRFTVLTSRVIRMERRSSTSVPFEDRRTIAFVNRKLSVPKFNSSYDSQAHTTHIQTDDLALTYQDGDFSAKSLSICKGKTCWHYGDASPGNLLGTIKSLDNVGVTPLNCTQNANIRIHDEDLHCAWGLVSRDGWSVVDDTGAPIVGKDGWWSGYNQDQKDLYFFGHGHDYRGALADFVQIAGRIAMVPRYASGIWWTRWFNYNNRDLELIVDDYESRGIPLSVMVLDMDFHTKNDWTGYTFDKRLFPFPADTLGALKHRGLHIAANIHDADGIGSWEESYKDMAKIMGVDPNSGNTIPFSMTNQTYVYALEDVVLKRLEDAGMDFWWIDWQQGGKAGGLDGGAQNPTIWTDYIRCTDHIRRNEPTRGMVLARWGGLGTHRYQVGFSGDVAGLTWQNLAYQPYFTATAANVGYSFWSHDIEGPSNDHELYVRWVQWAAWSGIFRSHDRGMSSGGCANDNPPSCANVKIWNMPTKYFEAARDALRTRAALLPYLYTLTRDAYDTGLGPVRPMYYDFPENDNAYKMDQNGNYAQYMLGDDLMVAPVVSAADGNSKMASKSIWVPLGDWYEMTSGAFLNGDDGNTILNKAYALSEVPVFAKGGSIIPTRPVKTGQTTGMADRQYEELIFTVVPGKQTSGSCKVYEDDGRTTAYLSNAYAWTTASYAKSKNSIKFSVSTEGRYPELPKTRSVSVRLLSQRLPSKVTVNDKAVPYSRFGGPGTWTYCGIEFAIIVDTGLHSTSETLKVEVVNDNMGAPSDLSGFKGRMLHANMAKANLDESQATPGVQSTDGGDLSTFASMGKGLTYLAGSSDQKQFYDMLNNIPKAWDAAVQETNNIQEQNGVNPSRKAYSVALLNNADN